MSLIGKTIDGQAPRGGHLIQGKDGSGNAQDILVDSDGRLDLGTVTISGGGGGTQYTEGDTDASITGNAMMMEGAGNTLVAAQGTAADGLLVNLGSNNDVTVASLPLPSGAATSSKQDSGNTSLASIDGKITAVNTGAVVVASSALPSGASTLAEQQTQTSHLAAIKSSVEVIDDMLLNEDAAHVSSDVGIQMLGVRKATPVNLSSTDGDYEPLQVSAGRLWVDPSGVTLTVDSHAVTNAGTFAVQSTNQTGDNTIGRVKLTDGTDVADILDLSNSNPLTVAIVDASGDQITSFGGGTQYTEDAAAAANPVGTVPILVRKDTPASEVTTDGDNVAQRGTTYGAAYVTLLDTSGSPVSVGGGTQYTEDAAAAANPIGTALIGVRADTLAGVTTTDGDNVAARMTDKGELYVKHVDPIPVTQSGTWDEVGINDSGNSITVDNAQLSVVGSGTEATAMRVTIATDSTGVLSIDDNGGNISIDDGGNTITVDGTVTANLSATDNAVLDNIDADTSAIQTAVELIDDAVQVLGTDTYTEATSKGITIGAVRRDADTTLVNTTNEFGPLQMDANGRLKVEAFSGETLPVSFTGSGDVATQTTLASLLTSSQLIDDVVYTDDTSTHSTGSSKGTLFMAAATPTDTSVNANDIGAVAMTTDRKLQVAVMDALPAGSAAIGKLAANSGVDIGDVDVTSVIPGTGATNLGKAIDTATGATDTGVLALATRDDALTTLTPADGDNTQLRVGAYGDLWVSLATKIDSTNDSIQALGNVAHDSADSGNPVKTGGRAINAEIAAVANNDRVDSVHDLTGKQIVLPYANPENFVSGAITSAMTGTTSTSLVAAPASGLRNYLTTIIVSNAHATVGTDVVIQDGNGGTTLLTIPAAAVYGGAVITLPTPLRQPTTATAIYCANVTTGASTKVSAVGYKGV